MTKISTIKKNLGLNNRKINFVLSERKNLLVCNTFVNIGNIDRKISVHISQGNLKRFENSNDSDESFRYVFEHEIRKGSFPNLFNISVQICLKNEITDYELKNLCYTFDEIKNKIGVQNFSFKKPPLKYYRGKVYDEVNIGGESVFIEISLKALKFINENPMYNTLKFEEIPDIITGPKRAYEILSWDEDSEEDKLLSQHFTNLDKQEAEYHDESFDNILNDINGDWGGLFGDEASTGEQNCD
jgi:hypothetical protein